ncbi:MAG: ThiF family adenylyltransferase [Patescibacteria group bacterium]|nr:ThiF family adenylyltransferase [Patescibacteria group bacterium]
MGKKLINNKIQDKFKVFSYQKSRNIIEKISKIKGVKIIDEFDEQIIELYKFFNPGVSFNQAQYNLFKKKYFSKRSSKEKGRWIWYPWNKSLVHLLSPKDFQRIRTSRNRYLITDQEQEEYRKACVAIAGVSVGSNIAITLRLQGGAQHLKLSDFDILELSNTNRITLGVPYLGEEKIDIVKQKILEIDPYTKLSLFPKGLNSNNIRQFCQGSDIVFDEVDNLQIKVLLRKYARKFKKPLIMLTDNDDGVLVDYYPYHKKIDVPLFHGLPDNKVLNLINAKKPPTKSEMVKLSSQVVGKQNISPRMMKSLKAVGKTLVSWPQLGTAAIFSGVIGAYMTRMIINGYDFRFRRRLIRLNDQLI